MCVQALQVRLRSLSAFLVEFQKKKVEQMRKARAKPASYFGHVGLGQGFGQLDSKGRANPPAKRQRLDDPVAQEADRSAILFPDCALCASAVCSLFTLIDSMAEPASQSSSRDRMILQLKRLVGQLCLCHGLTFYPCIVHPVCQQSHGEPAAQRQRPGNSVAQLFPAIVSLPTPVSYILCVPAKAG